MQALKCQRLSIPGDSTRKHGSSHSLKRQNLDQFQISAGDQAGWPNIERRQAVDQFFTLRNPPRKDQRML